jgi:glycosyltransferase involved in cell wall biosynthesis
MPKTSIIIPNYNREKLISETLNSLISQSHGNWEALVIDDGSRDNSLKIISDFAARDSRIKLFCRRHQPKGASTCRNIGIEKADGDYIIFLDSDDLLKAFALEQRLAAAKNNPEADFWVFQTVNFEGRPENEKEVWNKLTDEDNINRFLKLDSPWHTSGPLWKSKTVKKHLKFDEQLNCWQDVDFHLQALLNHLKYQNCFHLPPDVLYRRHTSGSISQGGFNKSKRKSQFYFIKKYARQLQKPEHKEILRRLYKNVLKKNLNSRYFSNFAVMLVWKLFKF